MRAPPRGASAFVLVFLLLLAQAADACAHASLIRAEPADGAVLAEPPATLQLTFNETVAPLVMRLIGSGGEVIAPAVKAENTTITLTPPGLRAGSYVLSWRVVSADGHPVGGALVFSIGMPSAPPAAAPTGHPVVRAALWAAKVVIYVALFVGIGGVFFGAFVADPPAAERTGWASALLAAGLVATPLSVGLQGLDALDLPLGALAPAASWRAGFGTSYGVTALVAALALAAGLCAILAATRGLVRGLALAALVGLGLALSLSGHAATAAPQLLTRPAVFLHALCVAFWVGALVPLMGAALRGGAGTRTLARFSAAIPYPLALLVLTGAALAAVQLDRLNALWTTQYGVVLTCKLAAVLALLALGAVNRYALVPRFETLGARRPLAVSIAVEIALAIAILALVALWRFTPPPRALALTTQEVSIHLHGERAMAQVAVAPKSPGRGAQVDVLVLDGELRPLAAQEVTLVLANPAAGIEPVRRAAADAGGSLWRVDGLPIPVGGRWRVRVEILINDFEKAVLEDEAELPASP